MYICTCDGVCVDMYMCIYMIVPCKYIRAHIDLYVRYDYVQRCEETVSVELRYIN